MSYRRTRFLPEPPASSQPEQHGLDGGFRGDAPADSIPPNSASDLSDIEFTKKGIRRGPGYDLVGSAASSRVLGLGDYKYVYEDQIVQRVARITRNSSEYAVAELWDGDTWSEIESTEEINDSLVSMISIQGALVLTNGKKILRLLEAPTVVSGGNEFEAGNLADSSTAGGSDPGALTNPVDRHYEPVSLDTYADTDPITSWADTSGNASNATVNSLYAPKRYGAVVNGHSVARFDGNEDHLNFQLPGADGFPYDGLVNFDLAIVAHVTDNTGPIAASGASGKRQLWIDVASGEMRILTETGVHAASLPNDPTAGFAVYRWKRDTNVVKMFVNGVEIYSAADSDYMELTSFGGTYTNDTGIIGDIAELVYYDRALTLAEGEDLDNYLKTKYDIGGSLGSVSVTVTPANASDNLYTINYDVTAVGPTSTGITIVLSFQLNGDEFDQRTYNSASSSDPGFTEDWLNESIQYEGAVADGDVFTIEIIEVSGSESVVTSINLDDDTDVDVCYFGSKADDVEPLNSEYTFKFDIDLPGANPGAFNNSRAYVNFYYMEVGGSSWIPLGSKTYTASSANPETINVEEPYIVEGLLTGAKFAVKWEIVAGGDNEEGDYCNDLLSVSPISVEYYGTGSGGSFSAQLHGHNVGTDADATLGVEYNRYGPSSITLAELSAFAPLASYVFPFAERVVALRDDTDPQAVGWCVRGDIEDWTGEGSGEIFLVDSRGDPVDELMAGAMVAQNVGAIFRRRSIMRVVETGNIAQAVGVVPWIDFMGTEAAHSVRGVQNGVLFLGHDRMVYYLTLSGLQPVGLPVKDRMAEVPGDRLGWVDAVYNPKTGEYIIGLPIDNIRNATELWVFEFGSFLTDGEIRWRKLNIETERLGIVSSI